MNAEPSSGKGHASKAALLSALVVPGAGQLYNRQWLKGAITMVVFTVASLAVLIPVGYAVALYLIHIGQGNVEQATRAVQYVYDSWINLTFLTLVTIFVYIYSVIDAYRNSPY